MVDARQDDEAVVASHPDHGIHIPEIRLVGRERIIVDPGLLTVDVGFRAVAAAHQLDLNEGETVLSGFLEDDSGILLG